jgi:hypothetical protein
MTPVAKHEASIIAAIIPMLADVDLAEPLSRLRAWMPSPAQ